MQIWFNGLTSSSMKSKHPQLQDFIQDQLILVLQEQVLWNHQLPVEVRWVPHHLNQALLLSIKWVQIKVKHL